MRMVKSFVSKYLPARESPCRRLDHAAGWVGMRTRSRGGRAPGATGRASSASAARARDLGVGISGSGISGSGLAFKHINQFELEAAAENPWGDRETQD